METVTIRELRNHGGRVVSRAATGETLLITSSGRPVAQLTPPPRRAPTPQELVKRAKALPQIDFDALRADLDSVMDQGL
jgi:prevent-host-death family protein